MPVHSLRNSLLLFLLGSLLCACGGTKLIKPKKLNQSDFQPLLISTSDQNLQLTLNWILVNNGPNSWAKRVYWDEYILQVKNISDHEITITNVTLLDYLNEPVSPESNRRELKRQSKNMVRRFKKAGHKIKYGNNSSVLVNSIAGVTIVTGVSIGAAGQVALVSSTGAGIAVAALVAAPVMAIGGIMRMVNNSKVNNEILKRQTKMPVTVAKQQQQTLDVFFPVSPAVQQIEISYNNASGDQQLILNIKAQTENLHMVTNN